MITKINLEIEKINARIEELKLQEIEPRQKIQEYDTKKIAEEMKIIRISEEINSLNTKLDSFKKAREVFESLEVKEI